MKQNQEFKGMKRALEQGNIVAIERDNTGGIKFGGAFEDDTSAALAYSASDDAELANTPKVIFVRELYQLSPRYQM